ncbi:homoserine dehydrogenase [Bacillus ginsengihumi]|uniref:Homoserine dehydrogenase n=1 Tax=Heyndrickxia ginsengihumi TaxID=363870 RepID=A0A6M0P4K3_9BACI|nr:homoserine dehydrogenase [Heyndrickxia ginsengihumi]MBE6184071.1 homoserine dehydrogenase [Bacillus sp. (in: firmicutes)]MCM3023041.1 homoserine dehydrogenase [Heyndrickxia ginsengihumi]NEY19511.1 homoserine dehydrogenase [Heyndrickxia ginsengihumi]
MVQKLAFIGFGVVGQGLAEILRDKKETLRKEEGFEAVIVAISDLMKGSIYHPDGLNIDQVLQVLEETGNLENYPNIPGLIKGWDSFQTIRDTNADTIIEVSFTDVTTGQPAIDHCKAAFKSGKNVVMTNKGPVALAYKELSEFAKENRVFWGFEGTVMSGTPALRMPATTLIGNDITEIKGILNGTTNFILTKMEEERLSFEEALKQAQKLGYAEADPTSDIEGYDVRYKAVILANYVLNVPLTVDEVLCKGITDITLNDIEQAKREGKRWKLLAKVKKEDGKVIASVMPEKINMKDPLASITGATNAILFECDLLNTVMLTGPGAGKMETGFSLLIDLLTIHRQESQVEVSF